jgi:hypothetical protein
MSIFDCGKLEIDFQLEYVPPLLSCFYRLTGHTTRPNLLEYRPPPRFTAWKNCD